METVIQILAAILAFFFVIVGVALVIWAATWVLWGLYTVLPVPW